MEIQKIQKRRTNTHRKSKNKTKAQNLQHTQRNIETAKYTQDNKHTYRKKMIKNRPANIRQKRMAPKETPGQSILTNKSDKWVL